jgi:hypothetical protein
LIVAQDAQEGMVFDPILYSVGVQDSAIFRKIHKKEKSIMIQSKTRFMPGNLSLQHSTINHVFLFLKRSCRFYKEHYHSLLPFLV